MTDDVETIRRISGVNPRKCMKCGKCTATCPAYDEMDDHPTSLPTSSTRTAWKS